MASLSERLEAARAGAQARHAEQENPWAQLEDNNDVDTPDVATLNEMFDGPADTTAENQAEGTGEDIREVSPTGSSLIRAATRINSLLEKRAINKAHSEALNEYRERDYNGYVDHLASVSDSSEATSMAQASAQMALDREYRKADRQEIVGKAKDKVRGFGRSALSRLKTAGLITLGMGVMSAQATRSGAKKGYEATKSGVATFGEKAGDSMMAAGAKLDRGLDKAGAALVAAQEKVTEYKDKRAAAKQERIEAAKERARKAKEAAEKRKAERHAKWAARRDAVKQYGQDVKEGFVEAKDAVVSGAKFAGNTVKTNAEFAGAATRELTREQKAKLGRFAAKARAAGEGAVDGWKSV